LRIGQRLTIYPKKLNTSSTSKSSKTSTKKSIPTGKFITYKVKSGDSLWLIAQKFNNVSVQNIKEWNDIWSVKSLKTGTVLKIYNQ
jgi:membrane-bound lytic murein transglycosylase D